MNLTGMLSTRHVQSIQSRNLAKFNIVCIWTRSVPMDLSRYTLESWVVHKLIHVVRLIKSHSAVHLRIGTTLQVRLSQSAMMRACLTMSSRKMKLTSPTTWRKFLIRANFERMFTTNVLFAISWSRLVTLTKIQIKRLHGKWQRMVASWKHGVSTRDWPGRFVVHWIGRWSDS